MTQQLSCIRSFLWIVCQHYLNNLIQLTGVRARDWFKNSLINLLEQVLQGDTIKGDFFTAHFIENNSEREYITFIVIVLVIPDFWC